MPKSTDDSPLLNKAPVPGGGFSRRSLLMGLFAAPALMITPDQAQAQQFLPHFGTVLDAIGQSVSGQRGRQRSYNNGPRRRPAAPRRSNRTGGAPAAPQRKSTPKYAE